MHFFKDGDVGLKKDGDVGLRAVGGDNNFVPVDNTNVLIIFSIKI